MAADPKDVVKLAAVTSAHKAHVWRQILEDAGIYCKIVGDYLDASFGSLDTIQAEIWVRARDAERARAIVEAHEASKPSRESEEES